jgi:hypothetical protein
VGAGAADAASTPAARGDTGDGPAWETTVSEGPTTLFHDWLRDGDYRDHTLL